MIIRGFLFCVILFQFFFTNAQKKEIVQKLIIGKWEMTGMESQKDSGTFHEINRDTYDFKSNKLFTHEREYSDSSKSIIQGKYKIKKDGMLLKLKNKTLRIIPNRGYTGWNRKSSITISSINEQELIFINGENKGIYFKKVKNL